ncbi:MAG: tetratricopeptide repeat protein [Novosphingobium sp.]
MRLGRLDVTEPGLRIAFQREALDSGRLQARLARNPQEAARAVRDAAERGSVAAQLVLGQILLDGRGTRRDPEAALIWFERAAKQGDPEAWNMVGRCHEKGWGVPQDYRRAAGYFEEAIRRGHVWAKVNLAQILMRLGDPADRPRAYTLFRQAAEAGNLKAINSLARFLEEGWVVPADPVGAARLYRLAAERGDHWAQFNLATQMWAAGARDQAIALIARAIAASDTGFRRRIAPLLIDRPDTALRQLGLEALARCARPVPLGGPTRAPRCYGFAGPPLSDTARRSCAAAHWHCCAIARAAAFAAFCVPGSPGPRHPPFSSL